MCGSKNYTYGDSVWKDKLTKYGTYNITYDEIGNPINYRNGITFSWKNGRWLASTTLSDNTTVTYQYNANGMRTKKTVGSTVTNYYYDSNNNLIGLKSGADVAYFYYDTDNSPISMKYNNNMYYYVKNLQGDIVKILDSNGSAVASYYYDAWGTITRKTVTNTTIDTLSPFRYRGYVYDTDTGFYYLQSRYYDPQTGRFLNADIYADTVSGSPLSTNTFAYCENNAINYSDKYGLYSRKDALFYLANHWNKRNTKFYSYSQDCANFVSQCLNAGGIKMNDDWHSYKLGLKEEYRILLLLGSNLVAFLCLIDDCHIYNWDITENWRLAKKQYNYFKNKNNGYTNEDVVKINSKGDIKTALKKYNIQPGDLLYFAGEEGNNIHHATIITGVKKIKRRINMIYIMVHIQHRVVQGV